jgi:hypothetical protein
MEDAAIYLAHRLLGGLPVWCLLMLAGLYGWLVYECFFEKEAGVMVSELSVGAVRRALMLWWWHQLGLGRKGYNMRSYYRSRADLRTLLGRSGDGRRRRADSCMDAPWEEVWRAVAPFLLPRGESLPLFAAEGVGRPGGGS